MTNSSTINDFIFRKYIVRNTDYSGNRLTGVSKFIFVSSIIMESEKGTKLFIQHNYTSSLPLNDAGTFSAHPYNLIQIKLSHGIKIKKCGLEIYAAADNVLNAKYSLGNDLNAAGNRFYNAAAKRSFLGGIIFSR